MSFADERTMDEPTRSVELESSSGALGVLLRFFKAPLSLHLIYNLTQVRQQDVGKFFIRLKSELGFIKGNPSSHKGWMSWYFFLRRNAREGVAWHCDMSWSDKPTRKTPPLTTQEYDPTSFLNTMIAKCFNAQELIRVDLLFHFVFSRMGIEVEGDLAERIMKAQMMKAYKQQESVVVKSSNPPHEESNKGKRKTSSGNDKRPWKNPSSEVAVEGNKEAGTSLPDQPGNAYISFVARPTTATALAFFKNFAPDADLPVVNLASDQTAMESLASHFMQCPRGSHSSRRSMNEVLSQQKKLMNDLVEARGVFNAEKKSLSEKFAASEANVTRLQEEMRKMK
ncbi:hypothetical protein F511_23391 [Dorcoceras hygrometricum]|uniref:Uncharacterized protein n=1 Tax=Dorcoceras hygrometricum TaxID=472368 RepID=A0A2Z7AIA1_9LAMI|nr:hypothetical protein F511_23391 [Dorcoceras hygrometricum]